MNQNTPPAARPPPPEAAHPAERGLGGRCAQPEEPTGLAWVLAVGLLASGGDTFSILPMIMLLYLGGAFN